MQSNPLQQLQQSLSSSVSPPIHNFKQNPVLQHTYSSLSLSSINENPSLSDSNTETIKAGGEGGVGEPQVADSTTGGYTGGGGGRQFGQQPSLIHSRSGSLSSGPETGFTRAAFTKPSPVGVWAGSDPSPPLHSAPAGDNSFNVNTPLSTNNSTPIGNWNPRSAPSNNGSFSSASTGGGSFSSMSGAGSVFSMGGGGRRGSYGMLPTNNALMGNMGQLNVTSGAGSQFGYDPNASLPPISQEFVRPNMDESKRQATSAGIMQTHGGFGFGGQQHSIQGLGLGLGGRQQSLDGVGLSSIDETSTSHPPGSAGNGAMRPVRTMTGNSSNFSNHGGNTMMMGGNQQIDEAEEDFSGVFSHTVDSQNPGGTILGGPVFQDPFAMRPQQVVMGNTTHDGIDPGMTGSAPNSSHGLDANGYPVSPMGNAHNNNSSGRFNSMDPPVSITPSSSRFAVTPHYDMSPLQANNPARRASEPHFKAAQGQINLPSQATLFPGMAGFPQISNNNNMNLNRRLSRDYGDLNTNQMRHLIAERRGSLVDVRQQQPQQFMSVENGRRASTNSAGTASLGSPTSSNHTMMPPRGLTPQQLMMTANGQLQGQMRTLNVDGTLALGDVNSRAPLSAGAMSSTSSVGTGNLNYSPGAVPNGYNGYQQQQQGYAASPVDYRRASVDSMALKGQADGYRNSISSNQSSPTYNMLPYQSSPINTSFESRQPGSSGGPRPVVRTDNISPEYAIPHRTYSTSTEGNLPGQDNVNLGQSYDPSSGPAPKKRPRRKFDQIERLYLCGFDGCEKSYGTLNHLNAHVHMQKHGLKRKPDEFKEIRKEWRKRKKEEAARIKAANQANGGGGAISQGQMDADEDSGDDQDQYGNSDEMASMDGHPLSAPHLQHLPQIFSNQPMMMMPNQPGDVGKWAAGVGAPQMMYGAPQDYSGYGRR